MSGTSSVTCLVGFLLAFSRKHRCCDVRVRAGGRSPSETSKQRKNTRLLDTPDRGKIIIGAKNFEPGDVIIREAPVLTVTQAAPEPSKEDLASWARGFASLPSAMRQRVLKLYYPSHAAENRALAQLLGRQGEHMPDFLRSLPVELEAAEEQLWQLFRIIEGTAFQLPTADGRFRVELLASSSRINHSCDPNAIRGPGVVQGTVEVRALRFIEEGSEINISYLDEEALLSPTEVRCSLLKEAWQFHCRCTRCVAPDSLRRFSCAVDGCAGSHSPDLDGGDGFAACHRCGALPASAAMLAVEDRLFREALAAQEATESAAERIKAAFDAKDWLGQKDKGAVPRAIRAAEEEMAKCKDLLMLEPRISGTHYYALKLNNALALALLKIGDGHRDLGDGASARKAWSQAAARLRALLEAKGSPLHRISDARTDLLIRLGGVYQRLLKTSDMCSCFQEALDSIRTMHWACGEPELMNPAQIQLERKLQETLRRSGREARSATSRAVPRPKASRRSKSSRGFTKAR